MNISVRGGGGGGEQLRGFVDGHEKTINTRRSNHQYR